MSKEFLYALGQTKTWPDLPGVNPLSLTYDDVLLAPQLSFIDERRGDLSVDFGPYHLEKPIVVAPMDTITGEAMIRAMAKLGAIGSLPRQKDIRENLGLCRTFSDEGIPCMYAVGLKNGLKDAEQFRDNGAKVILLDLAQGGMEKAIKTAVAIKKLGLWVMLGNIATYKQAKKYQEEGIDFTRVGVGPAGLCKTRLIAGAGVPQLSAVFETTSVPGVFVVADGGIKQPGDAAKALAAGAKMIMIGSMLAGTDEAPGELVAGGKIARGQASKEYMEENGVELGEFREPEGISIVVPLRGPVKAVVDSICGGVRSGMSYSGANNLDELREKAQFIIVSQAAQVGENQPHIVFWK